MDIRAFGNLTTQAGQQIKFEDFDKNGDGKVSEEEYNTALKEYDLDAVELSKVDTNGDKTVSNEEFQVWEQKIKKITRLRLIFPFEHIFYFHLTVNFVTKLNYVTNCKHKLCCVEIKIYQSLRENYSR